MTLETVDFSGTVRERHRFSETRAGARKRRGGVASAQKIIHRKV
jgi:hypothetical protein